MMTMTLEDALLEIDVITKERDELSRRLDALVDRCDNQELCDTCPPIVVLDGQGVL